MKELLTNLTNIVSSNKKNNLAIFREASILVAIAS